jgi:hypothetical protein
MINVNVNVGWWRIDFFEYHKEIYKGKKKKKIFFFFFFKLNKLKEKNLREIKKRRLVQ